MQAIALRPRHVVATSLPWTRNLRRSPVPAISPLLCHSRSFTDSKAPPTASPLSAEFLARHTNIVLTSHSKDPFINLAIENYLLTHSHPSSRVLFFYRNGPSVIIGRNQNPWIESDLQKLKTLLPLDSKDGEPLGSPEEVHLVRRRSGGGTVFHDDGNLNYSVIVPNDGKFSRAVYPNLVVRALRTMDENLDVHVNERNDIVVLRDAQWLKVSGSAFKLTKGRAMAHGTLLFGSTFLDQISVLLRSPGKKYIQAKGVESVRSPVGNLWTESREPSEQAKKAGEIVKFITKVWRQENPSDKLSTYRGSLNAVDVQLAPGLLEGRLELMSEQWRFLQTPAFEVVIDGADGGGIQLKMGVRNGAVHTVLARYDSNVKDESAQSNLQAYFAEKLQWRQLHVIEDWRSQLSKNEQDQDNPVEGEPGKDGPTGLKKFTPPDALVNKLSEIFPTMRRRITKSGPVKNVYLSDAEERPLKRLRQDGVLEVEERGNNTIREMEHMDRPKRKGAYRREPDTEFRSVISSST